MKQTISNDSPFFKKYTYEYFMTKNKETVKVIEEVFQPIPQYMELSHEN